MPTMERYDGTTVTWTGHEICYCTLCREVFNSVTAFDAHITGKPNERTHDFSWMPLSSKGYRIASTRDY